MADRLTEVTRTSWGKRIGQSLTGALLGGAMFLGSFVLLWWNEGRAIGEARALAEGAGAVIDVAIDAVSSANEGRLLHLSGPVDARPQARDDTTGLAVDALQLRRVVEMYQWVEKTRRQEQKKIGGGSESVTVYEYEARWDDNAIDSSDFKKPETHANPNDWPMRSAQFSASEATLGAFVLTQSVRDEMSEWDAVPASILAQLPTQVGDLRRLGDGLLYRGSDPERPQVGDVRVRYEFQPEATYSVVAKQVGGTLDRYIAANGRDVLLVEAGSVPAAAMFDGAKARNTALTWAVRLGGTLLMWLGLSMVFAPISRVLDLLPMLGSIGRWGIGLVTGLISGLLSMLTIGFAWVFYRPWLGGVIIVATLALFVWSRRGGAAKPRAASMPSTPPPPPNR